MSQSATDRGEQAAPALPDGAAWPRITVVVADGAQVESILTQAYPELDLIVVNETQRDSDRWRTVSAGSDDAVRAGFDAALGELLLWLAPGDELEHQALHGLAVALHTSGADVVVGASRDEHCSIPALADGPLKDAPSLDHPPAFALSRDAWMRVGGDLKSDDAPSDAALWRRLAATDLRVHVVGRPVLRRSAAARPDRSTRSRHVVVIQSHGGMSGAGAALARAASALTAAGWEAASLAVGEAPWATSAEIVEAIATHQPDLVLVGDGGPAPGTLDLIASRFPTVCIMHDMWLLTGGCRRTNGCTRHLTGCDARCTCGLTDAAALQASWEAKRRVLSSSHAPALVAPNRWMLGEIELAAARDPSIKARAAWFRRGVETDLFRPRESSTCREILGLDADRFIVLADARDLVHLTDAVTLMDDKDIQVVAINAGNPERTPPFVVRLPFVEDRLRMAMLLNAADAYVGSLARARGGQSFLEAAASGTPSVAFPIGGAPEAVLHGVSGLLTETASAAALATTLTILRDDACRTSLGAAARLWAVNEHSMPAASAQLHAALNKVGLDVGEPDLQVTPPTQPRTATMASVWSAKGGFSPWQGPAPEVKLDSHRWALGPVSTLSVNASRGGRHVIALRVRNFLDDQRIRIVINGRAIEEQPVPCTGHDGDHVIRLETMLAPGANEVELHCWRWALDHPQQPASLLIAGLHAMRTGDP